MNMICKTLRKINRNCNTLIQYLILFIFVLCFNLIVICNDQNVHNEGVKFQTINTSLTSQIFCTTPKYCISVTI